jgi:hypothetical protein
MIMCRRITEAPEWFRFWRGMKTELTSRGYQPDDSNVELETKNSIW